MLSQGDMECGERRRDRMGSIEGEPVDLMRCERVCEQEENEYGRPDRVGIAAGWSDLNFGFGRGSPDLRKGLPQVGVPRNCCDRRSKREVRIDLEQRFP